MGPGGRGKAGQARLGNQPGYDRVALREEPCRSARGQLVCALRWFTGHCPAPSGYRLEAINQPQGAVYSAGEIGQLHSGVLDAGLEPEPAVMGVDGDSLARLDLAVQQHPRQRIVDLALDRPAHRAGAELGLMTVLSDPVNRSRSETHRHVLGMQLAASFLQHQAGDLPQLLLVELAE